MFHNLLSARPWPGQLNKTGLPGLDWLGSLGCLGWPWLGWLAGRPSYLGVAGTAGWLAIWRISVYLDSSLFGQIFFGSIPKKTHLETSFFQFEFIRPGPEPSLFGHFRVYSATLEFIRPLSSLFGGRINSKVENLWRSVDSSLFGQLFDTCSPFEFIRPRQIRNFENTLDFQCFSTLSWWAPGIRVYSARGFEFIRPSFEFIRPVWPNKL